MSIWFIASAIALLVQILYWNVLRIGFSKSLLSCTVAPEAPVSVIIAARNEADRLPSLLEALSKQTARRFEVIVADDASTDSTPQILEDAKSRSPQLGLRSIRISDPVQPRKKRALTQAIGVAQFDRLLFTDADCVPGPDWVRSMATLLPDPDNTVLVGYSPFEKRAGLLNRFARYETFLTGYFTAAAIGLGRPYMAVGRNIAYGKAVFEKTGGFEHSQHILSGDDDLFVQEVFRANTASVQHVADPASFVESEAPTTWGEWTSQKTRHTSTGSSYLPAIQRHLLAFHASSILLWLLPLFGGWYCLTLLALRQVVQFAVLRRGASILNERDLLPWQPCLEMLYIVYNLVLAPIGVLKKRKTW